MGSNREKSNIAIAILDIKEHFNKSREKKMYDINNVFADSSIYLYQ